MLHEIRPVRDILDDLVSDCDDCIARLLNTFVF